MQKKWDRHTYIHSGLLDSTEVENNSKNMVNPIPRVKDDLKGSITDKNRELAVEKCQIVPLQTVKNS